MLGKSTGFRIGSNDDDAPASKMAQRSVVILDALRPIMGKGHSRQAFSFRRGVHLALNPCIRQVTNEDAVRAALGQRTEMLLQIRRHALQNRGKTARTGGIGRGEGD